MRCSMDSRDIPRYSDLTIRAFDDPEAQETQGGWWRTEWHVDTEPAELPKGLQVPPPPAELGEMALVAVILVQQAGHIAVQTITKNPKLAWNEYAYLSLILQAIAKSYTTITINGVEDHPILKISRM